ncbi:hypothetical protein AB0N17_32300 [Streptomyces sp. NPDC051133]|uniref:hypothetical protein n=1 Tax=Streptomyces sp. NPDC051133 TaxID=3155521 RepID=UPI003417E8F9
MDGLPRYAIVLGFFAVTVALRTCFARVIRRPAAAGGGVGAALAAYEEAFRPTGHAAHAELRAQAGHRSPADSPDGPHRRSRRPR